MHFPKQRFRKGVAHAIFWYGYADYPAKTKDKTEDTAHSSSPATPASRPSTMDQIWSRQPAT